MKTQTTTFESALQNLEETVDKLEEGAIPLDEAFNHFLNPVFAGVGNATNSSKTQSNV